MPQFVCAKPAASRCSALGAVMTPGGLMRRLLVGAFGLLILIGSAHHVSAHHSFAVYFDSNKMITIHGRLTEFRFSNPHGLITIALTNKSGATEVWKAETNAPAILRRRGWTKESLTVGEVITIEGWAARDDRKYVRMSKVTREDGSVVGTPMTLDTVNEGDKR